MKKTSWILSAVAMAALASRGAAQEPKAMPVPITAPVMICDPCVQCQDNCRKGGFIAGFEAVIVKPHFDNGNDSLVTFVEDPDEEDTPADPVGLYENEWNYEISPRFWIGYINSGGLGARLTYWWFDHEADHLETGVPDFGDQDGPIGGQQLSGQRNQLDANLEVHALDLDLMQTFELRTFAFNVGGGLRYGSVELDRTRLASAVTPFDESLSSTVDFSGFGPTMFIEARRAFGSGLVALFAKGRGSLLFGETDLEMSETNFERRGAFANQYITKSGSLTEENDVAYTLELQLGAEIGRELNNGRRLSAWIAWEGQLWGGTAMDGFVFHGGFPDPRPSFPRIVGENTADNNIGFVGIVLGAGLSY